VRAPRTATSPNLAFLLARRSGCQPTAATSRTRRAPGQAGEGPPSSTPHAPSGGFGVRDVAVSGSHPRDVFIHLTGKGSPLRWPRSPLPPPHPPIPAGVGARPSARPGQPQAPSRPCSTGTHRGLTRTSVSSSRGRSSQPFLLVFIFLYSLSRDRPGRRRGRRGASLPARRSSRRRRGLSILFRASSRSPCDGQEFATTKEIEDRVLALGGSLPVSLVASAGGRRGPPGLIAACVVFRSRRSFMRRRRPASDDSTADPG